MVIFDKNKGIRFYTRAIYLEKTSYKKKVILVTKKSGQYSNKLCKIKSHIKNEEPSLTIEDNKLNSLIN